MFPELSNMQFLVWLMTLWSIWFQVERWQDISSSRREAEKKKGGRRVMRPRSADDCWQCRWGLHLKRRGAKPEVTPWSEVKGKAGRKKRFCSEGYACPNPACKYQGNTDAEVHALVSNGWSGKEEKIRQWKCQACRKRFSERLHTPFYRLKKDSKRVSEVLTAMAEGMDLSGAMRTFKLHHTTITRWLGRAGEHSREMHDRTFRDFIAEHLQLDELTTKVKTEAERVWLWTAVEAKCKVLLVMHLGGRKQEDAHQFIHEIKERLNPVKLPVFTSDGLAMYFYGLTAHFGQWVWPEGARKFHWQTAADLLYGQFRKVRAGYRIKNIYTLVQWGERKAITAALQAIELTGKIQTAFVERLNLTLRELIAPLSRRTWSMAFDQEHLLLHVEWVRSYYHFCRPHMSLKSTDSLGRNRCQTPAVAAGVMKRRLEVRELLAIPLYPEPG
jgi:transposase-like protein